jgi:hypothetical protein
MANQNCILAAEPGEHCFEIGVEGPDEALLGMVGIAMAAKIERVDLSSRGHSAGEMVPPMCVRAATVEQNDRRQGVGAILESRFPMQTVEQNPILGMKVV